MRFLFVFLLSFSILSSEAYASLEKFCADAKTNADLVQCLSKTYATVQDNLRISYEGLMGTQNPETRGALTASQRDWLAYRDSNCLWESSNRSNESLQRIYELSCLIRLSEGRERALEVSNLPITEQRRSQGLTPRWMNVLAAAYPGTYWKHETAEGHDLNCDGRKNYIISGMQLPLETKQLQQNTGEFETYKILLGVAAMGETGKPTISVFDFMVARKIYGDDRNITPQTERDEPPTDKAAFLCSSNPLIAVKPQMLNQEKDVGICTPQVIQIQDPGCKSYTIQWQPQSGFVLSSDMPYHSTTE